MSRCAGILYGQLIGDSLGSLVEFQSAAEIAAAYPDGVRELQDGGVFRLIAGQPTDDSEMALAMARSIIRMGGYNAQDVLDSYRRWAASDPFDIGITCANALLHQYINPDSQANGALMRLSPLAILGMNLPEDTLADLAELDCRMTHTHPLCITINRIVAVALACAAAQELTASVLIDALGERASEVTIERLICEDATISPTDHPLYEAITATLGEFFPDATVVPMIAAGGSDLRFARRQGGVGYGFAVHAAERTLGHAHGQLHSHDEFLYLEDLQLTLDGYLRLAQRFLNP